MIRTLSISDLVELNPKAGLVLFRNGVVFDSETSGQSLERYCEESSLDIETIEKQIRGIIENTGEDKFNPDTFSIQQIVHYLTRTHHEYVRVKIPVIRKLVENLFLENSLNTEQKITLCSAFSDFEKHLAEHIGFEEKDVFPYILSMAEVVRTGHFTEAFFLLSKRLSISQIISQHADEVDEMKDIKKATNFFEIEDKHPLAYKVTLWALKDLETDLQNHNQLEDRHLFPQAQLLEEYLLKKANKVSVWN